MRPRALALSLVGCAAVLAGSYEAGQLATASTLSRAASAPAPAAPTTSSASGTSSSSSSTPSSTPSAAATKATGTSGTFAGATEQTQYGPVQVAIVVSNGRITDVKALQLTNADPRSVSISDQAAPMLREEALSAQSAKIDSVGGATFTSEGYIASLQSAIDKAGLS